MGRGHSARWGRQDRPEGLTRDEHNRTRIAQGAARLIAEHGITDWSLAKRKAARQLMLPEREALPGNAEIEAALTAHHALFGAAEHEATLAEQREEALTWMKRLAAFGPALVGGVAAGWATAHSDIRLELVADDAKAVELALINAGVRYRIPPPRHRDAPPELLVESQRWDVRLIVVSEAARRQRSRREGPGGEEPRLSVAALTAILAEKR